LSALPFVESLFNYKAYSKVGAAGIWQFTHRTGRRFLKIDYTIDERFDPFESTQAAARLLKENYEDLGNWPLAITAYNHGINGMKRAVATLKTKDLGTIFLNYQSPSFKFASKNFYSEFIAALEVYKNYRIYFGEIQFDPPLKYTIFRTLNYVKLSALARELELNLDVIQQFNPSLRSSVLQSKRRLPRGFELKLPLREGFDPALHYAHIPSNEKYSEQLSTNWYEVLSGDHLEAIARRFKTSVENLLLLNEIVNPDQIYPGQILRLQPDAVIAEQSRQRQPGAKKEINPTTTDFNGAKNSPALTAPEKVSNPHPTDLDLDLPTNNFDDQTNVSENRPVPSLLSGSLLHAEESSSDPGLGSGFITIKPDETLGHIADWLGLTTDELRKINKLSDGQSAKIGQKIKVTFSNISRHEFDQKRMEYHRSIEEDFFANYQIDGVKIHRIQAGENIWLLCTDIYSLPYWLIQKYNPSANLEQLQAGELLVIPEVVEKNQS